MGDADLQAWTMARWLRCLPGDAHRHTLWLGCTPLAAFAHAQGLRGRWSSAQRLWNRVALGSIDHPQPAGALARFNQGYCAERQGKLAIARASFERAVACNPGLDAAWLGLARVLAAQGNAQLALGALERQLQLQPWCPDGWVGRVLLQRQLGLHQQAQATLNHLRSFSPRQAMALASAPTSTSWPCPVK
jgi:tetratricopeptide (TPR) repeat protein